MEWTAEDIRVGMRFKWRTSSTIFEILDINHEDFGVNDRQINWGWHEDGKYMTTEMLSSTYEMKRLLWALNQESCYNTNGMRPSTHIKKFELS